MPLMRVDMIKGRTPEEIQKILDVAYDMEKQDLAVPEDDRYQIVDQHDKDEMIILDAGLGFKRSDAVVVFTILSTPRTMKQKKNFYKDMKDQLNAVCGLEPNDIMIVFDTNHGEDWSFGFGKAQFLDGEL